MPDPYRSKPEFRDETERLIWCTAFATHELHHEGRAHAFDPAFVARVEWHELARRYADQVLVGYRNVAEVTRCEHCLKPLDDHPWCGHREPRSAT
jgi:hypothetical protein